MTQEDPDDGGSLTAPVTAYTYDLAGRLLTVTDPHNRVTTYAYDDLDRLETLTQPDPGGGGGQTSPVTSYTYDLMGNMLTMTDPLGSVTTYGYDDLYRLTTVTGTDPDGGGGLASPVTTYAYDAAGQLTSVTDPESRATSFDYDALGRRTTLTQPDPDGGGGQSAPVTSYTYDLVGNLKTVTDPNSHVTTYAHDKLYRQTSVTNANSEVTTFAYDKVGNLLSLTDPETNTTEWEYDDLNRMTVETITLDSTPVERTYAYDAVGNLLEKIDRLGRKTTYSYDNLYQLDQEKWYDLTPTLVNTIDYDYNEIGQLDSVTDGSSSSTYDYLYDDLGRTTQSLFTFDSRTAQFDYEYDVASNMTLKSATLDSTLDFANTYAYDDLHRLTSFTQTGQMGGNTVADKHFSLAYNDASQRTELKRYADDEAYAPNLVIDTSYDYDLMGRLTQIDHTDGTSAIHKFDFTYDPASRIDTLTSSVDGLQDYGYDDTNQLTLVEDATPSTLESYAYDDNGNRTMTGYSTGEYNRLLSDGTYDYEYDYEGNRISRTNISTGYVTEYGWDHRNRLVSVTDEDDMETVTQSVDYLYDAYNQWIGKSFDADGDGMGAAVDEFYIHEGGQIVFRLDDSGDVVNRYVWDPTAVDQLFADEAIGDELRWSLTDHLGSIHDLVDNAGNVDKHIELDSFGNILSDSAPGVFTLFVFTGRPLDEATGLQNNWNRWYVSTLGVWLSEDPIGFAATDSNLHRYTRNTAVYSKDPDGRIVVFMNGFGLGGSSGVSNSSVGPSSDSSESSNPSNSESSESSEGSSASSGSESSQAGGSSDSGQGSTHSTDAGGSSNCSHYGNKANHSYPLYSGNWGSAGEVQHFRYNEVEDAIKAVIEAVGSPNNQSEPIVILGHSWGGDSALQVARQLNAKGYEVQFVAALDPVTNVAGSTFMTTSYRRPPRVDELWNYRQRQTWPYGSQCKHADIDEYWNEDGTILRENNLKPAGHREIDDNKEIADKIREHAIQLHDNWPHQELHHLWPISWPISAKPTAK